MLPNFRSLTALTAILSLLAVTQADAQTAVGVRANGMGGAFVGVADDATAVYWNPAGLATGALVSFNAEFGGVEPNSGGSGKRQALVAFSLPPIGLAYYRQGAYGIAAVGPAVMGAPSREEVRSSVHTIAISTIAVSLLHSVTEHLVVSATPKVVWGGDSTRPDVDASLMAAANRFRLGVVGRNLARPTFALDDAGGEVVAVERQVRIGGGWGSGWPGHSRVVVAVDSDLADRETPSGARRDLAAGVETWWLARRLGVRGGVRGSTLGPSRAIVSAGASALVAGFYVEGFLASGDDQRSWSLGLRYSF